MTTRHLQVLEGLAIHEARKSFWAFRRFMNPDMKLGWWQREIARELQGFWNALERGEGPKLLIEAPRQHGKTRQIIEFLAWAAGKNPDLRQLYTSYSDELGVTANAELQKIFANERYRRIFPATRTKVTSSRDDDTSAVQLNQDKIEFVGRRGSFINTTINGQVNGKSIGLGVVDDPIKSVKEARSVATRESTWRFISTDFMGCFDDGAALLVVGTRRHPDDPINRLKQKFGDAMRVVSYPAIAVRDEKHRKEGEPLFPELKSLKHLLMLKSIMLPSDWQTVMQQDPKQEGGNIIKSVWFGRYKTPPVLSERKIYADTAQKTSERNDFSVFECWGKGKDGKLYLIDMIRGKWEAPELKRRAVEFWNKHAAADVVVMGQLRQLKVEDAASGTGLIQDLKTTARIPVAGITRAKDKYTRCLDVLGHIESGYVMLPESAPFTSDFISEAEAFTADDSHLHDDQLDPMFDAINEMLASNSVAELWRNMA